MIEVAREFYNRLANRDEHQGDGKNTAIEFRNRFLKMCDNEKFWKSEKEVIEINFEGVKKIGPSFANEAFAYFTQYTDPKTILERILLINISIVQKEIIVQELEAGYETH